MTNDKPAGNLVLSVEQRDEILRAVSAIGQLVNTIADKSQWRALYVIDANLTIIRTHVANLPQTTSN